MKKLKWVILLLIISLTGGYLYFNTDLISQTFTKESKAFLVKDQLLELSEWTTLKYEYSNVIVSRTDKSLSLLGMTEVSYAEAIKLIHYSGYVKAGTDLSKLQLEENSKAKSIVIKIPNSKILDHVVETEKTTVEDIKGNVFSEYPTQLIFDEINKEKSKREDELIKDGFLDQANTRIKDMLTSFFKARGFEDVKVEFTQ